jgi:hypothetical protein
MDMIREEEARLLALSAFLNLENHVNPVYLLRAVLEPRVGAVLYCAVISIKQN